MQAPVAATEHAAGPVAAVDFTIDTPYIVARLDQTIVESQMVPFCTKMAGEIQTIPRCLSDDIADAICSSEGRFVIASGYPRERHLRMATLENAHLPAPNLANQATG